MRVAVTGGTGFIGRYLLRELIDAGHTIKALHRAASQLPDEFAEHDGIEWYEGDLSLPESLDDFVANVDAVIHGAFWRPGRTFRGAEGDIETFVRINVIGTLRLIELARSRELQRFVFISTCAVHERILDDRPLDEKHPVWPTTHYGAHKGAIECFVHSYGWGHAMPICALRPSGVYGVARPVEDSKWFDLIQAVKSGHEVTCDRGGKEVHAADVARAAELLLKAPETSIRGEAFNCCDRYVSQYEVAEIAKQTSQSSASIKGERTRPKHEISSEKLKQLGFEFGGRALLESTISELASSA